jgi:Carboxypeptidase regulatory-like domain
LPSFQVDGRSTMKLVTGFPTSDALDGYRAPLLALLCVVAIASAIFSVSACQRGRTSARARTVLEDATITGTVTGLERRSVVAHREVHVVDTGTGRRQSATTNASGGFTFKVRPGRYRVEIALRAGESVLRTPGVMHVGSSDAGARADLVIGTSRRSRVRSPALQPGPGLGPPLV